MKKWLTIVAFILGLSIASYIFCLHIAEATAPYLKQRCTTTAVSLTGAPTEDSYTFPKGTRSISIKARDSVDIKYSWQAGGTSSDYRTIPANNDYYELDLFLMDYRTIYLQSASPTTAEIEYCQ